MKLKDYVSLAVASLAMTAVGATVPAPSYAKSAQEKRQEQMAQLPMCPHKLGTLAIYEPENNWWRELGLGSPEALIKIFVQKSGCFTLLDRGKGMAMMEKERALASGGQLQNKSNIGQGQVKAADYVLVPDIVSSNNRASGTGGGAAIGGLLPGWGGVIGGALGGINVKKKTADVTLALGDMRTSEQKALVEGHAQKKDVSWGAGGGAFGGGVFGVGGATGYADTEIGQVITLAYLDAYTKLIGEFGVLPQSASAAAPQQAVSMTKQGRMYKNANQKGGTVRDLDPGMLLYPTGQKEGPMWEVEDELGNKGWVSSMLFQLGR